jgi:hypothetical protein
LEELKWQQADWKANSFALPEFVSHDKLPPSSISRDSPRKASKGRKQISLDEVPRSSYVKETPLEASKESKIISVNIVHPSSKWRGNPVKISDERKLISLADFLPSSNGAETPVQGLKERCKYKLLLQNCVGVSFINKGCTGIIKNGKEKKAPF